MLQGVAACWSKVGNARVKKVHGDEKCTFSSVLSCVHTSRHCLCYVRSGGTPKERKPCKQHRRGVLDVDSSIKLRFCDHDRAHGICAWAIDRTSRRAWCAPLKVSNEWHRLHYTCRQEESWCLCRQCMHYCASSCSSIAVNYSSRQRVVQQIRNR